MRSMLRIKMLMAASIGLSVAGEVIPDGPTDFLVNHCLDCHDSTMEKGEINLDFLEVDWTSKEARFLWERAFNAIERGEMPPEKKARPKADEKEAMLAWLDKSLTDNSEVGGTVLRRLNRDEYRNTIRALFGIDFELPLGFPQDTDHHHFDTVGETLVLSPPLMDAYAKAAATVADEIFPPDRPAPESETYQVKPDEMVISYSSGYVMEGAMRLASRCDSMMRSCSWPSKVEVKASGIYRIKVRASAFQKASDEALVLRIMAKDVSGTDGVSVRSLRRLKEVKLNSESPEVIEFEAPLYEGQTVVFYYANAPVVSDRNAKEELQAYFQERFDADPRYLAAWQQMTKGNSRGGFRGGLGWARVKKLMARDDLDLTEATPDSSETKRLMKEIAGNPVLFTETVAYDIFENGPALEIHRAEIEGPLEILPGPKDLEREKIQRRLLGENPDLSDDTVVADILSDFLSEVWRRPAPDQLVQGFHQLLKQHMEEGHSFEQGMHLVIRTALISPRFLYREKTPGRLDDHDLASRLSYFLTSRPPDQKLLDRAADGKLTGNPKELRSQAQRLLNDNRNASFVESFTGQWLDTRVLDEIMPDARLKVTETDQKWIKQEAEMFFAEMLKENRPMTDFIAPDFTFTSASVASKIYGLPEKDYNKKDRDMQRISLPRDGRYGGVLGQAAVLMATANGVDTQPVVRGVWILENVLGMPPPPPPGAVPAITPDTSGATTPRELLDAHTTEESCAGCHKRIDPIGYAMENFDAVGRWRDSYSVWTRDDKGRPVAKKGQEIDPSGQLPDGTPIADVLDLKAWVLENIDLFSECLAEKLMTYATGRKPNYTECKQIAAIVAANHEGGNGFRDLVLSLIESDVFLTK